MKESNSDGAADFQKAIRNGFKLAWAILLAGVLISTLAAFYMKKEVDGDAKRAFDFVCNEIQSKIQDRMWSHEQILRSGTAFFEQSDEVTRQEWRQFVQRQKVDQRLPGIQGVGFALLIPRSGLAKHIQEVRAEGFPSYQVRPEGDREFYTSIIYLEPFTNRNLRAFGYDMLSEPVRRAAMERARDGDCAALSGRVILVQETDKDVQAGTLIYVPVYRQGMRLETVDQRRQALLGWVYSPYRMTDLMQGIRGGWELAGRQQVHLEIFDTGTLSPETLLYNSQSGGPDPKGIRERFTVERSVALAGRQWTLRFTRADGGALAMDYAKTWLVLFGGAGISVLLSGLFYSLMNTRTKVVQIAKDLTAELGRSEQRHRSLLEDMPDGYSYCWMIFDPQGRPVDFIYLKVNPAFERLTGRKNVLGKRVTEITPQIKETNAELLEIYGRVVQTGKPEKFEIKMKELGRWLSISATKSGDGCFVAIFDDISGRKEAEAALRESENRFSTFFRASLMPAAISRIEDGRFVEVNDAFLKMYGYKHSEVLGRNSTQLGFWPVPGERDRLLGLLRQQGSLPEFEAKFRRRSGEIGDLLISAGFIELNGERHLFSQLLDITERKKTEEKIAELNRDFVSFLENTSDFIYFKDENSRIRFCSNTLANITGHRSWRELIGKHDLEIFPTETARIYYEEELPIFQHGRALLNREDPYYDASGKKGFVSTNKWPLLNSEGKVVGLFGISRDITALKQANEDRERLEAQNRQLQKSESLGRMAGAIAHHFNNKLQAVMMSLELAKMAKSQGQNPADDMTEALDSARQAAEVSTLMLTYLGQSHAKHAMLDLSATCLRSLSLLRTTLPQNVDLQTDLPSPGPFINAAENQIQQILTNLLTNAWEAMEDKEGTVRLIVKPVAAADIPSTHRLPIDWRSDANNYACLEIADTGCGIPEEHFEKLFEPFFSTKFTGRGLGLPAVLGIVRSHKGAITFESQIGRGSTFRIFLPVTTMELPRKPVPAVLSPVMAVSGTVLVVDDENLVRKTISTALKSYGYKALTATDGAEAVEIFQQRKGEIDCVLTDLTMPRMDGWKVLEAVRKLKPGVPVILSSGYSESQVLAGEHTELPQALLSKPYVFETLKETMMQVMTNRVES